MQNEERGDGEMRIDFGRIFAFIIRKWWIVLICLIVGGATGFIVGKKQESTTYTLQVNYTVGYDYGDTLNKETTDQQSRIASIIAELAMTTLPSDIFFGEVAEQCNADVGIDNYVSEKDVEDCLSFDFSTTSMQITVTKGNVIYVIVTSNSADKTKRIMTATNEILVDYIRENSSAAKDTKILFYKANNPQEPTKTFNSNTLEFTLVGGFGCALLAAIVLAIIVIADQRVKSEVDLSDRYGIPVLGSIPDFEDKNLRKGGYYHDYKYKE
jgi:capsular polysaccharide biosynthesis protein